MCFYNNVIFLPNKLYDIVDVCFVYKVGPSKFSYQFQFLNQIYLPDIMLLWFTVSSHSSIQKQHTNTPLLEMKHLAMTPDFLKWYNTKELDYKQTIFKYRLSMVRRIIEISLGIWAAFFIVQSICKLIILIRFKVHKSFILFSGTCVLKFYLFLQLFSIGNT